MALEPFFTQGTEHYIGGCRGLKRSVIAEDEIQVLMRRFAFVGEERAVSPQPWSVGIQEDVRALFPFSKGCLKVSAALINACRDRLPVTDRREWGGDNLANRSRYRTLICMKSLQ